MELCHAAVKSEADDRLTAQPTAILHVHHTAAKALWLLTACLSSHGVTVAVLLLRANTAGWQISFVQPKVQVTMAEWGRPRHTHSAQAACTAAATANVGDQRPDNRTHSPHDPLLCFERLARNWPRRK